MKEVKVGDDIFSKNDREIYATVRDVTGDKVTVVRFGEYYDEYTTTLSKSDFKYWNERSKMWDLPNWTLN